MRALNGMESARDCASSTVGLDFEAYKDRLTFFERGERRKVGRLVLRISNLLLDEPLPA
jgi:hypothetical protein